MRSPSLSRNRRSSPSPSPSPSSCSSRNPSPSRRSSPSRQPEPELVYEPEPEPEYEPEPEPEPARFQPIPVAALLAEPDLVDPPGLAAAAPPAEDTAWEALAKPVPISHFERFKRDRAEHTVESAERARLAVYAGLVTFFSLALGAAMAISLVISHIPVPGGEADALVAPWRAWLAIVTGVAGVVVATMIARRRGLQRPLFGPRVGLGGLAVTGLGLLCGSLIATGAGGVVLLGGAAIGAVRRS